MVPDVFGAAIAGAAIRNAEAAQARIAVRFSR